MKARQDENESVSVMFRNVFVKEVLHGSSLLCGEEVEKTLACWMHRLMRRLFLSGKQFSNVAWKNAFTVAVISLQEGIEGVLKKEKRVLGKC